MATKNVYITDGLKADMDELELNWSQIATTAFQTAIELERIKKVNMTAASKTRLRQSRESATDKRHAEGVAKGKVWATERSEYDELDRVSGLASRDFDDKDDAAYALARAWADTAPDDRLALGDVEQCLQMMFSSTSPTLAEIAGFIEGAADVFDNIDVD
jgi:hypothetical protein